MRPRSAPELSSSWRTLSLTETDCILIWQFLKTLRWIVDDLVMKLPIIPFIDNNCIAHIKFFDLTTFDNLAIVVLPTSLILQVNNVSKFVWSTKLSGTWDTPSALPWSPSIAKNCIAHIKLTTFDSLAIFFYGDLAINLQVNNVSKCGWSTKVSGTWDTPSACPWTHSIAKNYRWQFWSWERTG